MEMNGLTPNTTTHALMIRLFAKEGALEDAMAYLQNLFKQGISPAIPSYYALPTMLRKKQDIYSQTLLASYILNKLPKDSGLLNRFLMELVKNVPHSSYLRKTMDIMIANNIGCDRQCYTELIQAYIKKGCPRAARMLLKRLEDKSPRPDLYLISMRLKIYKLRKEPDKAISFIRELENKKVKLNAVIYTHLMDVIGPNDLRLLREIYQNCKDFQDEILFGKLIELHLVNANLEDVRQLIKAVETSTTPEIRNDASCNSLILRALLRLDENAAWEFVSRFHATRPDDRTLMMFLNSYVSHYVPLREFRKLHGYVWAFFRQLGITPDFKCLQIMRKAAPNGVKSLAHQRIPVQKSWGSLNYLMHRLWREKQKRPKSQIKYPPTKNLMAAVDRFQTPKVNKKAEFAWDLDVLDQPEPRECPDFDPILGDVEVNWDEL